MTLSKEPALLNLAEKMSSLNQEDKKIFLKKLKKCADLFKVSGGTDIFLLSHSQSVVKYQLELIASLYRRLSGKKYQAHLCAEFKDNPKLMEEKNLQDIIHRGIYAYCNTSDEARKSFENKVKKEKTVILVMKGKNQNE